MYVLAVEFVAPASALFASTLPVESSKATRCLSDPPAVVPNITPSPVSSFVAGRSSSVQFSVPATVAAPFVSSDV